VKKFSQVSSYYAKAQMLVVSTNPMKDNMKHFKIYIYQAYKPTGASLLWTSYNTSIHQNPSTTQMHILH